MTNGGGSGNLQSSTQPNWNKKETKEPFDYWELSEDKTGFPRRWSPTGFSSQLTLKEHFKDHGASVGAKDEQEYQLMAKDFFSAPRGKTGDACVRKNGDVLRYDYGTNCVAVATSSGIIKSFWNVGKDRGKDGADEYWRRQKE